MTKVFVYFLLGVVGLAVLLSLFAPDVAHHAVDTVHGLWGYVPGLNG